MKIGDRLEDFRTRFSECTIVAFADVSTRMVLAASTQSKTTQEALDRLCQRAVDRLNSEDASSIALALSEASPQITYALELANPAVECYVRSPLSEEEVVCLHLTHIQDIRAMAAAAQDMLRKIGMET